MGSKSTTSSDIVDTEVRPRTPTEGRRRRPSTHEKKPVTVKSATAKLKTAAAPKLRREDKREAPKEMETTARPKNVHADGSGTHSLEASNPSKRPSRKSTRGGANRAKPDSQQQRQNTRALRSPESRHASRAG